MNFLKKHKKLILLSGGVLISSTLFFIGFIGYLHTEEGRKLPIAKTVMAVFGYKCPVEGLTAAESRVTRDYVFKNLVQANQYTLWKHKKQAGPFILDIDSQVDVDQWIAKQSAAASVCKTKDRGFRQTVCEDFGVYKQTLTFTYSENLKLMSLDIFQHNLAADVASQLLQNKANDLIRIYGKPTKVFSDFSVDNLKQLYQSAFIEFYYSNFIIKLNTAHLPSGVTYYEQYISVNDLNASAEASKVTLNQ